MICILLINAATIDDNVLSNYVVFCREGRDAFVSVHPYLKLNTLLKSQEGSEKVYLFQGPYDLPQPYTKTTNNKFCIDIPLGNPNVEFKKLLDR